MSPHCNMYRNGGEKKKPFPIGESQIMLKK